jgi:two-component system chemotaxis response regulator CheY
MGVICVCAHREGSARSKRQAAWQATLTRCEAETGNTVSPIPNCYPFRKYPSLTRNWDRTIASKHVHLRRQDHFKHGFARMAKAVLIVDDNAFIRQALCELFTRETDFKVCGEAENGREATEKAQQLHPDLIVLDLSMPVMNGLEAARVLKRLMPTVPIIMFSAFGDRFVEQQARLVGISEVVPKSENAAVLVHKARGLLYATAA